MTGRTNVRRHEPLTTAYQHSKLNPKPYHPHQFFSNIFLTPRRFLLRTVPPPRLWRNPSQVSVYPTHPQRSNPVVYGRHPPPKERRNPSQLSVYPAHPQRLNPVVYRRHPHPGSGGTPANFRSTKQTLRGRTQWFTDNTQQLGCGGTPAKF